MNAVDDKPWDIKILKLSLGGEDDEKGFITFRIFDDKHFEIYEGDDVLRESKWFYEEIDLNAAYRIRDFLIYALRDKK